MKNTYWSNNGKYQKEYDSIKHLVPIEGDAKSQLGQLLRFATNVYYDHYNNGDCNFDVKTGQWQYLLDNSGIVEFKTAYNLLHDGMLAESCSICANGEVECSECYGYGETDCYECGGEGCEECGDGQIACDECGGSGWYSCDECSGTGEIAPFYFEGSTVVEFEQVLETAVDKLVKMIHDKTDLTTMPQLAVAAMYCELQSTTLIKGTATGIYNQTREQELEGMDRAVFTTWFEVYNIVNDYLYPN